MTYTLCAKWLFILHPDIYTQASWKWINSLTIPFELVAWNCWQMIAYNEFCDWTVFCTFVLILVYFFICIAPAAFAKVYVPISCSFLIPCFSSCPASIAIYTRSTCIYVLSMQSLTVCGTYEFSCCLQWRVLLQNSKKAMEVFRIDCNLVTHCLQ